MEPTGESVHMLDGVLVPPFVTQAHLDKIKDIPLREDDIWIVTYPKAGTTWTQHIVRLARNKGQDDGEKIINSVPWLEAITVNPDVDIDDIESLPTPRAFKSHCSYERMTCGLPSKTPGRYIYVARNPKDIAVSRFHQYRSVNWGEPDITWDEYFERVMEGRVLFGNYFDHALSWWAHRNDENVLFMKYEDMKRDLVSSVARIAKFAGLDLDEKTIKEVAAKATFDKMKDNSSVIYTWSKWYRSDGSPFMRKGEVGDWKNHFSKEQSDRMDAVYLARCKPVGLEFDF